MIGCVSVQPYEYTTRFYDQNLLQGQGPFASALQGPPRFDFLRWVNWFRLQIKHLSLFANFQGQTTEADEGPQLVYKSDSFSEWIKVCNGWAICKLVL